MFQQPATRHGARLTSRLVHPTPPLGADFAVRPATHDDVRPAFAIFRRSVVAYAFRHSIVPSPEPSDEDIEAAWALRGPFIEHLWRTAAHNWIAEDASGRPIGWAMSVRRGDHLELTHFFVEPGTQSKGVGRELLARAMPRSWEGHRSIVATLDPRALSLYLRSGVRFITGIIDLEHPPRPVTVETDLEFEALDASDASVSIVAEIEEQVLGHRREVDTRFLLGLRPAWVARRGGMPVGFAFGDRGDELTGPIGALDPADIPALLAKVETEALAAGRSNVYFSTPLENTAAVDHLLGRGFTLDPFVVTLLADDRWLRADRWIHTGLSYIL